jgi:serine/threonine protein kinase
MPSARESQSERAHPQVGEASSTGSGVPETIGRYRLLQKLAKGGMAEVFAARSYGAHGFEKTVALKRILPKFGRDPQFVRMMVDEAKISVLLNHPNIAQIFELGEQEGDYFIVMEFVPGQSLSSVVKRLKDEGTTLPTLEACYIIVELLQGLHASHIQLDANGSPARIIHRDVSPQNTLVSFDGHVKVIDFGIARARDRLEATEIGTIKGKLRYLAPEMIDPGRFTKEGDFDHRVDVFAAGICLWELVAGRPLFPGDDEMKVYDDITDGSTPDLAKERRCDVALMKIIAKALERRLDKRYATAEAFADDLRAYVYRSDPSFTHKRVASILDRLFPHEKAEHLALERGGAVVPSAPSAQTARSPGAGAIADKPLPKTAPDSNTRSDRQLKEKPVDEAATALADMNGVDPENELGRKRDVTVMTLVSRQHVVDAAASSGADSSGVFSMADDPTLTVAADNADAIKAAAGVVSGGARNIVERNPVVPRGPAPGRPATTPPSALQPRINPDETPLTTRQTMGDPPLPNDRRRLVAASAIVGVVLALLIVAGIDALTSKTSSKTPPTTTTPATTTSATTTTTATSAPPSAVTSTALTLTSVPGALIDAGGQNGFSPFTITTSPGQVVQVAVTAPGFVGVQTEVKVLPQEAMTVDIPLTPEGVTVTLDVEPENAIVTIGDAVVATGSKVPAGAAVVVVVSAPGFEEVASEVTPVAGAPLVIKARLTPKPKGKTNTTTPAPPPTTATKKPATKGTGTLVVKTTAVWGNVTIDGKAYSDTTPLTVTLPAGRHEVVVSHPPRNLVKKSKVDVQADKTVTLTVSLE